MKKFCRIWSSFKKLWATKTFRSMRLTFYAVLLTVIQSWALDGYAQTTRLDLEMKNSTVREVLAEIEDMSRFRFLYNSKMVDVEREVSISTKNKTIEKVLEKLFDDKDVEYTIVDRQIVLFAKGSSVSNSDF